MKIKINKTEEDKKEREKERHHANIIESPIHQPRPGPRHRQ